jgi:ABC-2 type transport system ATP-binding protein
MSSLTFAGVSKFYGDVLGVMDVHLEIDAGVTGLLGPNGAGKSTLIKLAVGLLCPDQGDVRLDGRSTWAHAALGHFIGYLPDIDALPGYLTATAFLRQLLRFHGYTRREASETAEAALARVGLATVAHRRLRTYSRGMGQRLKLAQALAHDPPVYILDEPLTGLDPVGRREVIALIQKLGDQGRVVLVSSHILHEVEAMTDRVALMRQGRLIAAGRIPELRSGLLETPYRIRVRTDRARELAVTLMGQEPVLSARVTDAETLVIEAQDPEAVIRYLTDLAARSEVTLHEMEEEDQDLEAVFRYTVNR